eukprot:5352436-Pleurochrysis_carterae.AAC.1
MHYEVSLQSVYARKWWNSVDIHNNILTLQDDTTSPPSYTNFSIPSGSYATKSSLAQAFAEALVAELKRVNIIDSSETVTINTEVSETEQRLIVRLTGMTQIVNQAILSVITVFAERDLGDCGTLLGLPIRQNVSDDRSNGAFQITEGLTDD